MYRKCDNCHYSEPVYFKDEDNGEFYAFQGIIFCNKKDNFVKFNEKDVIQGGQCDV